MILVYTEKDLEKDRMMVTKWVFIPKEKSEEYKEIPGQRKLFDKVPYGFYKDPTSFFIDEGILRRYYTD